jgi:Transmembrane family, TMEM144 of transporters
LWLDTTFSFATESETVSIFKLYMDIFYPPLSWISYRRFSLSLSLSLSLNQVLFLSLLCLFLNLSIIIIQHLQEPVANIPATLGAFVLLACGLVGMSYYSSIGDSNEHSSTSISTTRTTTATPAAVVVRSYDATKEVDDSRSSSNNNIPSNSVDGRSSDEAMENIPQYRLMSTSATAFTPEEEQPDDMDTMIAIRLWPLFLEDELRPVPVVVYHVSQRTAGICGAVFNGIMTGSSLIPLHYAKQSGQNAGGAHYMISLAIGALLSNVALWLVLYFVQVVKVCCSSKKSRCSNSSTPLRPRDDSSRQNDDGLLRQRLPTSGTTTTTLTVDVAEESSSFASSQQSLWAALDSRKSSKSCCGDLWQDAYRNMPRWYFRQLYAPGICAGILLALSMFGSIIAVTQLGQGIGNSVVQCKIIISGLWGIFYFVEIRGNMTIFLWFASAALSVTGIVWLSQERLYATSNGSH